MCMCVCNRTMNKFVYFKLGLEHMVKSGCCKDLHKIIRLEVDDKPIPLPPLEGLIILNILRLVALMLDLTC